MTDSTCQRTSRHGRVSARRAWERLENQPNQGSSLNKGIRTYEEMRARIVGLRRLHAENPRFSAIPSGWAPCQVRYCQRTSVTLLNSLVVAILCIVASIFRAVSASPTKN